MSMVDPSSLQANEQLQAYLDFVRERQEETGRTKPYDSNVRKVAKHLVPKGFLGRARFRVTDVMTPYSRARARRIAAEHDRTGAPLWLHLGSGGEHKDGWVNIDLAGEPVEAACNVQCGTSAGRRRRTQLTDVTRPDRPQGLLAVQEHFYGYGHCTLCDFAMREWLLQAARFIDEVVRCDPEPATTSTCRRTRLVPSRSRCASRPSVRECW